MYDSGSCRRGWSAGIRAAGGIGSALDRADARNEVSEWYDGYHDAAEGAEKYARRETREG